MSEPQFPPSVDVGIVFALAAEQGCFEDLLSGVTMQETPAGNFRLGTLGEQLVATVVAGAGRAAATKATETLFAGHRPRLVISAGFCGGLDPQLRRNDIVVADKLLKQGTGPQGIHPGTLAKFQFGTARVGPFVEVDRIVAKSADKKALAAATNAIACEMESSAVAAVCAARQTPFLAIRVVSDVLDEDLPGDLEPLLSAQPSAIRTFGTVLGTLWRRPSSVKDLLQLKETALLAADALAKYLATIVAQSPPRSTDASQLTDDEPRTTN